MGKVVSSLLNKKKKAKQASSSTTNSEPNLAASFQDFTNLAAITEQEFQKYIQHNFFFLLVSFIFLISQTNLPVKIVSTPSRQMHIKVK
jgi:hypothetical protein